MPERQILGICIGGLDGADSGFGKNGSARIKLQKKKSVFLPLCAYGTDIEPQKEIFPLQEGKQSK